MTKALEWEVEQAEQGQFWAHLVNRESRRRIAPDYGRVTTAEESIASARRRYEVEQLEREHSVGQGRP